MNNTERILNQAIKEASTELQNEDRGLSRFKPMVFIILTIMIALTLILTFVGCNQTEPDEPQVASVVTKTEPLEITPTFANEEEFTVTYYCGCAKCCGKWSDGYEDTATGKSGTQLTPYYSIAVDPDIIPLGTICYDSEGNAYEAVDTGSMVKGYHVDMFTGNHQEAVNLGKSTMVLNW